MSDEYIEQAEKFLAYCDATLVIEYLDTKPYFAGESVYRDVYTFTILTPLGSYSATFGNSIHDTERCITPSAYDVLSCLDGHPPADSFIDWCGDMGYDDDCQASVQVYDSVVREWEGLKVIFTEEQLEQLDEIC